MLVDDELLSLKKTELFVKNQFPNLKIKVANNGIEACTLIGSYMPHIIILEPMMRDIDGIEIVKHLKSDVVYENVKVICLTTLHQDHEKILEIKGLDVQDFVHKPFDQKELSKMIKRHIREFQKLNTGIISKEILIEAMSSTSDQDNVSVESCINKNT